MIQAESLPSDGSVRKNRLSMNLNQEDNPFAANATGDNNVPEGKERSRSRSGSRSGRSGSIGAQPTPETGIAGEGDEVSKELSVSQKDM